MKHANYFNIERCSRIFPSAKCAVCMRRVLLEMFVCVETLCVKRRQPNIQVVIDKVVVTINIIQN